MSPTLKAAIEAAKAAGRIHREYYGRVRNIRFKSGNKLNLVTEVDGKSEKVALGILRRKFPTHNFWGEESGRGSSLSEYTWLVDPLDGTTNYAHAYPFFCVSIALVKTRRSPSPLGRAGSKSSPSPSRGEVGANAPGEGAVSYDLICAVVYDSLRDECFTAEKGKGAFLNGKRLHVTSTHDLKQCLVCTGFAYQVMSTNYNFDNFRNFVRKSQGVRRDGSAAMNLAYVAAGRFDGFWERGIQAWDMAAGILLVKEAGGKVTDITGKPFDLMGENALASNGKIHGKMFRILKAGKDEKHWKALDRTRSL